MNSTESKEGSSVVKIFPETRTVEVRHANPNSSGQPSTRTFLFDRVYGPRSTQVEIYKDIVKPQLEEILKGYNCTIFAYGQTGTGKTFTMEGERSDDPNVTWETDPLSGIIPRTLHHLFDKLESQETEYSVRVSFVELYNEQLFDLLGGSEMEKLSIYDDPVRKGSVILSGNDERVVRNKQEVYEILKQGAKKRQTATTLLNACSRESKLTRLLQDSLGGKTITTVIATVSPCSTNFDETVSTLEYAGTAKSIKNHPQVNEKLSKKGLIKEYTEQIEKLRRDLLAAREKNGIYLAEENYEAMRNQIESQEQIIEETNAKLKALTLELAKRMEEYEEMDRKYRITQKKWIGTKSKLADKRHELKEMRWDLAQRERDLEQERHLKEGHARTEAEVYEQAKKEPCANSKYLGRKANGFGPNEFDLQAAKANYIKASKRVR